MSRSSSLLAPCLLIILTQPHTKARAEPTAPKHAHDCKWTAADGSRFDLSSLTRKATQGDYEATDPKFKYYLNVCGDTELLPHQCKRLAKHTSAPAYQVFQQDDGKGDCYWLGSTKSYEWSLIDETRPQKGIELVYKNGEMCGNKRAREIRYHFICAHGFEKEESVPLFVVEHQNPTEICHYNVTWPTTHGCPLWGSGNAFQVSGNNHFDLLFYPGLSVLLWSAAASVIGYIAYASLNSARTSSSRPYERKPKGRVIDDVMDDFHMADENDALTTPPSQT